MRKLIAVVLAAALAGVLATTALAASRSVKVGDDFFVRNNGATHTLTVKKGTKLKFRWVGSHPHNVETTSGPASFKSKVQTSGTFSKKLKKKGTYKLICVVHPTQMKLTVRVE